MKSLLFAAALTAATAALAQPADPAGQTVPAGNTAPERDARGIPVISDPATAPSGTNQPFHVPPGAQVVLSPNQRQAFATQPSTGEKPPCSRTVTDNCTQTYERGAGGPG